MQNYSGVEDFEGFIYLNPNNVCTQWNIARGFFNSASIFHTFENHENLLSVSMVEMLSNNHHRLNCEISIESIRQKYYPNCVSRLSGIFVFDSPEDALNVMAQENWGSSQLYEEDLTDVGVAARNSSKHDSNWIELIFNEQFQLNDNWIENTKKYWEGLPVPNKQPIWERIVDGGITIWGTKIREAALKNMQALPDIFQGSLGILEYAINAARLGSYDGEMIAFLLTTEEKTSIKYFMREIDKHDPLFIKKMIQYFKENPDHLCQIDQPGEWRMPNLNKYEVILSSSY